MYLIFYIYDELCILGSFILCINKVFLLYVRNFVNRFVGVVCCG